MDEVAKKNAQMKGYVFTLPAPVALAAFTVSELRGIGSQSNALGVSMIRTENVFLHVGRSIDVFKREHKGIVCLGLRPMNAVVNQDLLVNKALKRSDAMLWAQYHQKAHMVLPTSVKLTSDEFLAQNQHWLDLLLRLPLDEDAQQTVKEHYRLSLFLFCGMINEKARQDWLRESPLPEVTVNRHIPLPKMVETQPMRRAVRTVEEVAFGLRKTNHPDAAKLKRASDTISLFCDVQYQADIEATAEKKAAAAEYKEMFQQIQFFNNQAMAEIFDAVNNEQHKRAMEFRGLLIDGEDEDGASAGR
ncbi:hypothetical protein MRS44_001366 [Fusarium solani]|uniref:uncharacterized protein n=1 Tax=Fusarium solani TaxID=169388 RepID=UPI0032C41DA7|nr:hypothetical protein MRS44_001366 [Fusarium solani]